MSEINVDEACVLDYLLEVQEEPLTSTQRSGNDKTQIYDSGHQCVGPTCG